jgi:ABC-type oligopeptide transport system substrate-binding subunit
MNLRQFALILGLSAALCSSAVAAQKDAKAKASKPTTHVTQGTIVSINNNQLVLDQTVRGKAAQTTLTLNPQTLRTGNLVAGNRVTAQYREENGQKVATAVRERATSSTGKPAKTESKQGKKS